ncbi:MAG TPA: hypothetical protein VGK99_11930 [Acidobacteriota bacterium]|jgi:hypothetical protein
MASDARLTVELLMKALRGLVLEGVDVGADREQVIEDLAHRALSGLGLSIKYLLAKNAEAVVSGLGTFSLRNGQILYQPDDDLLEYVLLSEPNSERRSVLTAMELIRNLETAASLIGLVREHLETLQIPAQPRTTDEEMMLTAFGEVPAKRLKSSVERLLADIMVQFKAAGAPLSLGTRQPSAGSGETIPSGAEVSIQQDFAGSKAIPPADAAAPASLPRFERDNPAAGSVLSDANTGAGLKGSANPPPSVAHLSPETATPTMANAPSREAAQNESMGQFSSTPPEYRAGHPIDVKNMDAAEILRILREDPVEVSMPAVKQSSESVVSKPPVNPLEQQAARPSGESVGISASQPERAAPPPAEFTGITEFPDFAVGHDAASGYFAPISQPAAETRNVQEARNLPVESPASSRNVVAFPDKETARHVSEREEQPAVQQAQSGHRADPRVPSKGTVMTVKDLDSLFEQSLNVLNPVHSGEPAKDPAPPEPPAGDLPLSLRAHEALRRTGIATLPAILRLSQAELVAAVGMETAEEIKNMLQIRGLALRS